MNNISEKMKNRMNELELSYRDLAEKTSISKSALQRYMEGDVDKLPIDRVIKIAKELRVTPEYLMGWDDLEVPAQSNIKLRFVGYGSCGNGAINEEPVEWRDVPEWILGSKKNYDNYFLASAKGDSMERAGIKNGSLLIFYRQPELNNGEIGVFSLNGEEYIKRYSRQGDVIILNSEALKDGYEPIVVTKDDCFTIIAKLYKCITDFE